MIILFYIHQILQERREDGARLQSTRRFCIAFSISTSRWVIIGERDNML